MAPVLTQPEEVLASVRRSLTDVGDFQLPRLRDLRGPLELQRELADEARLDLERAKANIEICREMAETARAGQRASLIESCSVLEEEYTRLKIQYRQAVLHSKRAITASAARHDLLAISQTGESSSAESTKRIKARPETGLGEEDALQSKTNEVTDALRRTTQLMQAELERSVLSVQLLDEQTSTLRLTATLYDTYHNLLGTSAKLVKALERADWYDRLIIGAAFLLFLLVVGWILKRRVLDKVVGGVVGGVGWWVGGSWKLLKMGAGVGKTTTGSEGLAVPDNAGTAVLPGTRIGRAGAEAAGKVLSSAAAVTAAASAALSAIPPGPLDEVPPASGADQVLDTVVPTEDGAESAITSVVPPSNQAVPSVRIEL